MKKAQFVGNIEEVPSVHPASVAAFEDELDYFERTNFEVEGEFDPIANEADNITSMFDSFLAAQEG